MEKLEFAIREVENGFLVYESYQGHSHVSQKSWVAPSVEGLKQLVGELAASRQKKHKPCEACGKSKD